MQELNFLIKLVRRHEEILLGVYGSTVEFDGCYYKPKYKPQNGYTIFYFFLVFLFYIFLSICDVSVMYL